MWYDITAKILAAVGAINWGLVAISEGWNLVALLQVSWLITTVYALVGISGLYVLYDAIANKK